MSRKLAFPQCQHARQVHWFVGCTIETLSQYLHQFELFVLYVIVPTMIIVDSVTLKKERLDRGES